MALYIPTWEERNEAKKERAEIIQYIMEIQNPKLLRRLSALIRATLSKESHERPMSLNEFVDLLEPEMLKKMSEIFQNENLEFTANAQIKELLERAKSSYSDITLEDKAV